MKKKKKNSKPLPHPGNDNNTKIIIIIIIKTKHCEEKYEICIICEIYINYGYCNRLYLCFIIIIWVFVHLLNQKKRNNCKYCYRNFHHHHFFFALKCLQAKQSCIRLSYLFTLLSFVWNKNITNF